MLNKMKQHQDISTWDDRDLLYRGVPIPGTNILDLVKGASLHRAPTEKRKPKGWDAFMNAMAEDDVAASPVSALKPPFVDQKSLITGTPSTPWTLNPRSRLKFGDWINW
ncbi:hypothetical protein E2320_022690 [Naja naja]|nr:hypothetical protein E2320_022690 [Naja naja]